MNYTEKEIILSALFHDIGKFIKQCRSLEKDHEQLGKEFFENEEQLKSRLINILNNDGYNGLINIIENHHYSENDIQRTFCDAERLSTTEISAIPTEDLKNKSGKDNNHLYSVFNRIEFNNEFNNPHYFNQRPINADVLEMILPVKEDEKNTMNYNSQTLQKFTQELIAVLSVYNKEDDFKILITFLDILLEKYFWCLPGYSGNCEPDISLYNHSRDTSALALSLYRSSGRNKLNLIVCEVPDIESYIFEFSNEKMLKGRTILVHILAAYFCDKILNYLDLTILNKIMDGGNKFFILAPENDSFEEIFNSIKKEFEEFLLRNFDYELRVNMISENFTANDERKFGEITEQANLKLRNAALSPYERKYFYNGSVNEDSFVLNHLYNEDSDLIKCFLTSKPIRRNREEYIEYLTSNDERIRSKVDKLAKIEFNLGEKLNHNDIIEFCEYENGKSDNCYAEIITDNDIVKIKKNSFQIYSEPDISKLIEKFNIIREKSENFLYIPCFKYIMYSNNFKDLKHLSESSKNTGFRGFECLVLIKADINNLGLIISHGFNRNNRPGFNTISRITSLSSQVNYFFNDYLNIFLKNKFPLGYIAFTNGDRLQIITHQSYVFELVKELNNSFNIFTCQNPVVNINFSVSHFKPDVPIRIIGEFAEQNLQQMKNFITPDKDSLEDNFSSGETFIFDTKINNELLYPLNYYTNKLYEWCSKELSASNALKILRNLYYLAGLKRSFPEKNNTSKFIYHPLLTYQIRKLKNIPDEVRKFLDFALIINNNNNSESEIMEKILFPAVCGALYKLGYNS
jgi:CRISPR-associated protein Csm1